MGYFLSLLCQFVNSPANRPFLSVSTHAHSPILNTVMLGSLLQRSCANGCSFHLWPIGYLGWHNSLSIHRKTKKSQFPL